MMPSLPVTGWRRPAVLPHALAEQLISRWLVEQWARWLAPGCRFSRRYESWVGGAGVLSSR